MLFLPEIREEFSESYELFRLELTKRVADSDTFNAGTTIRRICFLHTGPLPMILESHCPYRKIVTTET